MTDAAISHKVDRAASKRDLAELLEKAAFTNCPTEEAACVFGDEGLSNYLGLLGHSIRR